uniref:Uncharacterized protein n=1 Tax=Anguilla anguilla TaxID=7936 RepID=A0A0E9P7U3_ANGAN
MLLFVCRESG